jgi:6-pyruvoyltetrahydropterin/6-carboxytetrahydropterin synthase
MPTLTRTVRFSINPPAHRTGERDDCNGYAGIPAMRGLGRHYSVEVHCRGEQDPVSGYLLNIKDIDRAVRAAVVPRVASACDAAQDAEPGEILPMLLNPLAAELGGLLHALRWSLSPYYSVEMSVTEPRVVLLRQRFDFAASHRLHAPTLTDDQNRAAFGKCNSPGGHGHNYRVEPCVAVTLDERGRQSFTVADLERLTDRVVVQRFDHKHLDLDTRDFGSGGVTSTVENIARVCFGLLAPEVRAAGAELRGVTVWETDRTSSTYPG